MPRDKSFSSSPRAPCRQERTARLCTCISRKHEVIVVKAGTLGAQVGTEKITVPAGGTAVLPAGVPHRWWNAGDDLLEVSGHAVPAVDLDRFLQALFAVLNASSNGRPSIFHFAHVLWRHRNTQLISVKAIQRIVLPVLCLSGASWANTADRAGPVRPSRAPVRPLWTLTPRAALLAATLLFTFPRRHETFSIWIVVSHSVFLSVLSPIALDSCFYLRSTRKCKPKFTTASPDGPIHRPSGIGLGP